jgi:class 3 adenylate cyclase
MPIHFSHPNRARGFALFVDMVGFTRMVKTPKFEDMAQFTHDVLYGAIQVVEASEGEIVTLTGDGFLAILPETADLVMVCTGLAKDLDKQCEYMSNAQAESNGECWPFCPGGPSLKVGVEFGEFEVAEVHLRYLGVQNLFIGSAINYASRILEKIVGNECRVGPKAAKLLTKQGYAVGPKKRVSGKRGESPFAFHKLDLGDIWIQGERKGDSYWG